MDWHRAYIDVDTPWDLRQISPPLVRFLQSDRPRALGIPERARIAVPGCGRGHDVRAWAWAGHEVTGFDLVPEAVAEARQLLRLNRAYGARVLCRDVLGLGAEFTGQFDAVYDYTCFCALPPHSRRAYAESVAGMLRGGGLWVGLVYPTDPRLGHVERPPYTIDDEVLADSFEGRLERLAEFAAEDSVPRRRGAERWSVWRSASSVE